MQTPSNTEQVPVPVVGNLLTFSPSPSFSRERSPPPLMPSPHSIIQATEHDPLLPSSPATAKKPFYRARPMWLVPFAISASVIRGMTMAPRVQVFTQLSCNQLYHDHSHSSSDLSYIHNQSQSVASPIDNIYSDMAGPYHLISLNSSLPRPQNTCSSDPAVQSRAARLQTIMVTTMGFMSALTTGWWGHFSERHGRTRVLAASTLGLLITDLAFYLVSLPNSPWARHAQTLFVVAPFFEGLLGGWTTLQAATTAYISDCTSDGSRAQIFSRISGVLFLGLAVGPAIGAFLMHHPILSPPSSHVRPSMTSVFEVAVFFSFINIVLLFLYPESLNAKTLVEETVAPDSSKQSEGFLASLLSPMAIFLPKLKTLSNGRKRKDWSFSFLAIGLFMTLFSMGVYQIKYLYAQHTYHWGAEQLSYYISFLGGLRAVYLLFIMPLIIQTFKPKSNSVPVNGRKPKPTPAQLSREIKFDVILVRLSLVLDLISHTLVVVLPQGNSELLFVALTSLPCFGSGSLPAANSLALSMMKLNGDTGTGKLLGAFAMLQAVGQTILGPLVFGMIYSITVATYPKAIFAMAASMSAVSLIFVFLIRPKVDVKGKQKSGGTIVDIERGRSRISKDLRSGLGNIHDNI